MPTSENPHLADPSPYIGPRPFKEGEIIFGRSQETSELYYRLLSERIILLYSPSGAGKSSLIQAGLIPRLWEHFDTWRPTRVSTAPPSHLADHCNRFAFSLMLGLEEGLPEELRRPVETFASIPLVEYARDKPRHPEAPSNIFIFIDQCEEVLTCEPANLKAKEEFFKQLGELLLTPDIWAILALREDFLGALDPYASFLPTQMQNRFRLDRLSCKAAMEAIEGPTLHPQKTNRQYMPHTVESLASNLARIKVQKADGDFLDDQIGNYVEPVQLQVVCQELWESMDKEDLTIDPVDIEYHGNVSVALSNYYEHRIEDIAGEDLSLQRKLREWIDAYLITASGLRNQVIRGRGDTQGLDNDLVEQLIRCHLVRPEVRGNATWYELSHDRLINPIRNNNLIWNEKTLNKAQKAAALWKKQDERNDALLLTGQALVDALEWEAKNSVEPVEAEFLRKSKARQHQIEIEEKLRQEERENAKNAHLRAWAYGICAVVAVILSIYTWRLKGQAEESTKLALSSLKSLYIEKARIALQATDHRGSAMDYQEAWMYHLAGLYFSDQAEPEVAGRLLQSNLLPDYNEETSIMARNLLKSDKLIFKAAYAPGTTHLIYALSPVAGGYSELECSNPTIAGCQEESFRNVRALAMRPDGKQLGVRYRDKGKVEWIPIRKPLADRRTLELEKESASGDGAIAMGPDLTAVGSPSGDLVVLKPSQDGFSAVTEMPHLAGQKGISALAWQQGKESMLASAWKDSSLHVYEYANQKLIKYKEILKYKNISDVNALVFWPGSSLLVSGHGDGYIRVWDYEAGELVASLRLHDESILALSLDPGGENLTSVSRDGVERTTKLKPRIFDRPWELKSLLAVSGKKLRDELYNISKKRLGYSDTEEPRPTKDASELALKHFDLTKLRLFIGPNEPGSSKRSDRPRKLNLVYPELSDDGVITLLPDQVQAARSEVSLTQEIPKAFKIEFEYIITTDTERDPWTRGNFLAFEFFKNLPKPDADMPKSQDFARSSEGYALHFDVYPRGRDKDAREHIVLLDLKQQPSAKPLEEKAYEANQIFTGQNWRKACIEVRAVPGKALCKPEEPEFQGIHVYLNGEQRFNYPKELNASQSGLGFAAFSGVAMSKRQIRRVFVTPASELTPSQPIPFERKNTAFWHYESDARRASDQIQGFPKVEKGILLLTPAVPHWRANSILITPSNMPKDYSVEFEYSIHNNQSSDPQRTGQGLVFLFGKDTSRYEKGPSPDEDVNEFEANSGCGIHFEVYQTRSIHLRGNCLKGRTTAIKANLIQGLPDVYTDVMDGLNEWRTVRVEIKHSSGRVRLFYEGAEVLDEIVTLDNNHKAIGFGSPSPVQFKLEAAAEHKVRNVVVRPLLRKSR